MRTTKGIILHLMLTVFVVSIMESTLITKLHAEPQFLTIGSGDTTGIYFAAGLAIAKIINENRDLLGIRASVESTPGSVFNLNAIAAGYLEFGFSQSDKLFHAVSGVAEWSGEGPQKDLRAVCSLHRESVCLVAAVDAGIKTIADLRGKRVNLGDPGAAEYMNAVNTLESAGLNAQSDIIGRTDRAADAPRLLHDNRIDAFFCTMGHPSEMLEEAVSGKRRVRFIPVTGPNIDRLISRNQYYVKTTIPVREFYPQAVNQADVETFGVVATFCTSARMSNNVVYLVTKELFQNFDYFKKQHPAFANLTKEGMLNCCSAVLHPGALKYYKEAGLIK